MLKKLMATALIMIMPFCCVSNSFSAIGSGAVLDVSRSGDDANGGGYNNQRGGTNFHLSVDYSNQDASQENYTTLQCANATKIFLTGAETFNQNSTGNIIQIQSGTRFSPGFYEIVSIASSQAVVLDRVSSQPGGSIAVAGVGKMGGRLNSLWQLQSTSTGPIVAGNTIYVKNGTYTRFGASTAVLITRVANGNGTPITWIGYNTSRTDQADSDTRPILDGQGVCTNVFSLGHTHVVKNFIAMNSTGVVFNLTAGTPVLFNCRVLNGTIGFGTSGGRLIGCEGHNNSTNGFSLNPAGSSMINCYAHDNVSTGIIGSASTGLGFVFGCISENNKGWGYVGFGGTFLNCIAFNNTSGGFSPSGSSSLGQIYLNNISMNNSGPGFTASTTMQTDFFNYNCYFGNTNPLGIGTSKLTAGTNDKSTNPLFKNITSNTHDFTVLPGSSCINTGYPSTWNATGPVGNYSWNIGVDQGKHQTLSSASAN